MTLTLRKDLYLQKKTTMKQRKFKIGELSQLCNVTTRALYHYEKMGLFVPDTIDPYTGYRYYNSEQLLKRDLIYY